ncbi:hydroxyacylglutathione hydrolase [Gloeobacter violaceus]|uniref:Hydroxyacylglutathione hydrolase n=1 Tax=Gloeobacter violaceus (strain ATCC 29082 / PCC 7421) TaxID=251221 RepID=GLO2_GLOVI|nr:hydroxyacylglutathione hydrolase [Gloeobacter violaceus]Q7NG34.1 RecName: Full=Hydroxyacylglutathione hydrolase; AltName: Full=Glyoxalase II; Short=Glx II [Gloeobacter violaceus PCC 7421]BAC91280.1 gll3339 [Gloeobacter violaceus PCC 7421]
MLVHRLNALKDNYVFVLEDEAARTAAVVDPAEARPVLEALVRLGLKLVAIFNTHHHHDHVGGNRELLEAYPGIAVYASRRDRGRIPGQTVELEDGDTVAFGCERARVIFVPGHTHGHIAYHFAGCGHLFCGDTLFAGGCGRLFEGTARQMQHSLGRLRELPGETQVWCAHEYTLGNLRFAHTLEPDNAELAERLRTVEVLRARKIATVPSTMAAERATNPFLRWESRQLQRAAGAIEPEEVFAHLRALKDRF